MPENSKDSQTPKAISRRQFITGTTEGAISYEIFGNPIGRIVAAFADKIDEPRLRQERNRQMLEQAKRKPAEKKS